MRRYAMPHPPIPGKPDTPENTNRNAGSKTGGLLKKKVKARKANTRSRTYQLLSQVENLQNKFNILTAEALQFIDRFYRAPAGYAVLDHRGEIIDCNPTFSTKIGLHPVQLRGTRLADHIIGEFRDGFAEALREAKETGSCQGCPTAFMKCNEKDFHAILTIRQICCNPGTEAVEYRVIIIDNFLDDLVELAIKTEKEKASRYFDLAGVVMVVIHENGIVAKLNRKGAEVLECPAGMIMGKNWFDTVLPMKDRDNNRAEIQRLIAGEIASDYNENTVITLTGKEKIIAWHNAPMQNESGSVYSVLCSGVDITVQKKMETQLRINAAIDSMTGVLNRREGFMELEAIIAQSHAEHRPVTICLLDLNNLKYVNDHFGHLEGDEMIVQTARMITKNIKKTDVVFRLGGDEFLIIFRRCNGELAEMVLDRIEREIEKYNAASGKPFNISWCSGIEEWNELKMDTVEDLIRTADEKMYRQKREFHSLAES